MTTEVILSPAEAIDTGTPTGRAMWQMIGVLAELEQRGKSTTWTEFQRDRAPDGIGFIR